MMVGSERDETEAARLAALRSYRILDTDPERAFDDLALLASQICDAPMALITLVDADRQWFKARVGVSASGTPRSISFCAHAMRQHALFIIPDAREDRRFRDNPLVTGEPGIRFYAGASLTSPDGHPLGTLCVIDRVPRTLRGDQLEALDSLRRQVEAQLELRRNLIELHTALAARDRAEDAQARLVRDLRHALDEVNRLSALIPYCSTCRFNMVIPADPREVPPVTEGIAQMLREKQWTDDEVIAVELAVTEALTNAIRHGCGGDPRQHVQCVVTCDEPGEVNVVIRDAGPGFNSADVADPLAPENLLKAGGRGVFLINQLMDEVGFRDGGREVAMRKRRVEAPRAADDTVVGSREPSEELTPSDAEI
jgi:anti-sigma regulatory factor (Ser/Thr protein kinase)